MNILKGTRTYLCGAMEFFNGAPWRDHVQKELEAMEIHVFNPYQKPFLNPTLETDEARGELEVWRKAGEYEKVVERMTKVRLEDKRLCDISDFLFAYINLKYPTVGSWEEMFYMNSQNKPIFLVIEGGLGTCPFWLFGTIPIKYIYGSIDEAVEMLRKINSGEKSIDNFRWRILDPKYIH